MSDLTSFQQAIQDGYTFKGDYITLGSAMYDGKGVQNLLVKIPLKTLNRHGLIAGATGTGKTKTLQAFAEELSKKGIPSLMMDIKGDLSGLAAPGVVQEFITSRHQIIGIPYEPKKYPVELMTISQSEGVRLKATITEFGPVLLSKIMGLNDTQASVISLIFAYCDNHKLPLLDLKDLRKVLQYVSNEGKESIEEEYGAVASTTVSIITRKIVELEQQGADNFFGEKSFEPSDLLRTDSEGKGILSIIRLVDIQNQPKLFSTFMLSLLAEIFAAFPEVGDLDKPKLCIFIDEAHLIFEESSKALLDQLEVVIKLIRSKGVGIYFCTQNPIDIPDDILAQLGLKIQHALRAFTERDRKAIEKASENYPISEFYNTENLITQLGIGEALVSALNEKGIPTPLAATLCRTPESRMDILNAEEITRVIQSSSISAKYNEEIDRESAFEILNGKIEKANSQEHADKVKAELEQAEQILKEKEDKLREAELKNLQKDAERRKKEEEKEIERLRKIQIQEERESERRRTTVIKEVTRAATSGRGGGLFGQLVRGLLGALGGK